MLKLSSQHIIITLDCPRHICVACEAKRHIGITLSIVCLSVRPSVCLSVHLSHSHSYVSQATHAFLGMLPLFLNFSSAILDWILTKCGRKQLNILYQVCVFRADLLTNVAGTQVHNIKPFGPLVSKTTALFHLIFYLLSLHTYLFY